MQKNVRVIRGKYQFSLLTSAKGHYLRRSLTTAMCVIVCDCLQFCNCKTITYSSDRSVNKIDRDLGKLNKSTLRPRAGFSWCEALG